MRCGLLTGTHYGASLYKQIKNMNVSQHNNYFCEFCGRVIYPLSLTQVPIMVPVCLSRLRIWTSVNTTTTSEVEQTSKAMQELQNSMLLSSNRCSMHKVNEFALTCYKVV